MGCQSRDLAWPRGPHGHARDLGSARLEITTPHHPLARCMRRLLLDLELTSLRWWEGEEVYEDE